MLKANAEELEEICLDSIEDLVTNLVDTHCNQSLSADRWEIDDLVQNVGNQFSLKVDLSDLARSRELYTRRIYFKVQEAFFKQRDELINIKGIFTDLARDQYLQLVDELWRRHLQTMDQLRSGIGLRGYGQRDPKREYQREGFNLFKTALLSIKSHVMQRLLSVRLQSAEEVQAEQEAYERYVEEQRRQRRDRERRTRRAQELAKAHHASANGKQVIAHEEGPSPDQILVPSKEQNRSRLKIKKAKSPKKKESQGKGQNSSLKSNREVIRTISLVLKNNTQQALILV